jgi:CHAT domain-containing protein
VIELAQRGLKLAQEMKDVSRQGRALAILANTYRQMKDYPQAIAAYEQSITAAREAKESNREAALLNGLAGLYNEQLNDYRKAIEYYQQALQVAEKLNDRESQADTLLNIANSSRQAAKTPSDYRQVIELTQRGLKVAQEMKDASRQARALAILAITYGYLKDYPQAIAAYEQSIAAAREANDSNREAAVLNGLGNLYNDQLNDYRKAIEYYQQALQLAAKLNERESQTDALLNIANSSRQIATSPPDYQKVIELAQQGLKLAQETNNRPREARALALLGDSYKGLQEYTKVIAYYQQSIATAREAKDEWRAAKVLSALGSLYHESLNNYQKALEYYQQGLQVAEKLQNSELQIEALLNTARALRALALSSVEYQKVIELAQQGLKLAQDTQNRAGEARALGILGMTYNSMKDYPKAIELLQQSLAIAKDTKDEYRESDTLTALSNTYSSLRDYPKAINYAQQALSAAQKNKNSQLEAIALINLVGTHYDLGAYSEALTYTQQLKALGQQSKNKLIESLASVFLTALYYVQGDAQVTQAAQQNMLLAREIQNPLFEGMAIWVQGWLYADAKDYTKALGAVQETLKIAQKTKNQYLENLSQGLLGQIYHKQGQTEQAIAAYRASLALNNEGFSVEVGLARVYRDLKMPVTAITYYKQAISKTEKIRTNIRELSTDLQKSFLGAILDIDRTKNADIYRELADVLISQGRITEAQQVLERLKVQELNDFSNRVRAGDQLPSVELNETEQKIKEKHGTLINFGKRLDECEQTQCSTLEEFQAQLNQLNQDFTQQIQRIEQETQENRVTQVSQGTEDFIASADKIVSAQPNTVLIYPLVLPDKVRLLWASKGGVLNSQVCPMGEAQLWQTISEFRDLLKTPNSDIASVKATGKKLYDCLVKPLESELQKNNIQNLVFVPDRATNYIPMGALFDGEKFLIERYSVSSVLNAGLTDVSDRLPPTPQNTPVLALGLSDAKAGFKALPNVPLELDAIVRQQTNDSRGIYPGAEFLNQTFTLDALQNNLRDRKILHIATHGSFVPKNPKESYLLLGNGDKYPIYQIQYLRNLRDIHLVVLSACETALGGPDASGTEIAGISSYFLRDKAKAVMASLWLVNDGSTSLLMQQFYNNLSTDKQSITKAQALRQAQLSLLNKQVAAKDAPQRSDAEVILEAKPGAQLPRSRTPDFSHPYYWAPFILIGNSL